ncbi:MAG TPA: hypothetical protein VJB69_03235 [Candidatus Paceibacterota bacterium]
MMNLTPARTKIKYLFATTLLLAVLTYGTYQMRGLINGPQIIIDSPRNGASIDSALVTVRGRVTQVDKLFLNGERLTPDHTGRFESQLLLAQGYNIIRLAGADRFGRQIEEKLELVLKLNL